MSELAGKKSLTIGSARKVKSTNSEGETFMNSFVVLGKDFDITYKGESIVNALNGENRIINVYDAENSALALRENGHITDEELQERLRYIKEKGITLNLVRKLS